MADPVRPLRLGTVVWFGSLEFMTLGHEYDMVLLTPRAPPSDDEVTPGSPGAGVVRAAALAALAKHDTNKATPTLRESGAPCHPPPISYDQLLAQGPWLGTCLA